ncbi:uncharacterized protein M6B38_321500 [Iris pallida]|uniref:PRA1 family protein n=1 Tax=Iris pallida TaxID=29817 RepID=A0AAX6FFD9_IRIPA|nr:uncharacterized protein M6B38_135575 [Iris pallida]KAJ6815170.1 uncharacterized protein M6B38_135580 [Iris pallida]KAJ6838353.1 uncharacterized protein M6B38_321500 [Iris pallida]
MITRSKLVEQLRDYQVRSQNKRDVVGALSWGLLFCLLVIAAYVLYFRFHKLSAVLIFLGILIPISVRIRHRKLARKRERRLLLPLSM